MVFLSSRWSKETYMDHPIRNTDEGVTHSGRCQKFYPLSEVLRNLGAGCTSELPTDKKKIVPAKSNRRPYICVSRDDLFWELFLEMVVD